MDKLLQIIAKLREEIVPEGPISKMAKDDILRFIEDASILKRMRAFHQKGDRGIRSAITEDEDETLVPGESEIQKWRVGKLRKLLRDFHRATAITKKYTKFSAARLRSHIKRNRYEEMLYGDDLPDLTDTEDEKPEKKNTQKTKTLSSPSLFSPCVTFQQNAEHNNQHRRPARRCCRSREGM